MGCDLNALHDSPHPILSRRHILVLSFANVIYKELSSNRKYGSSLLNLKNTSTVAHDKVN